MLIIHTFGIKQNSSAIIESGPCFLFSPALRRQQHSCHATSAFWSLHSKSSPYFTKPNDYCKRITLFELCNHYQCRTTTLYLQDVAKILCFQLSKPISPTNTGTNKHKLGNTAIAHFWPILHVFYEKTNLLQPRAFSRMAMKLMKVSKGKVNVTLRDIVQWAQWWRVDGWITWS